MCAKVKGYLSKQYCISTQFFHKCLQQSTILRFFRINKQEILIYKWRYSWDSPNTHILYKITLSVSTLYYEYASTYEFPRPLTLNLPIYFFINSVQLSVSTYNWHDYLIHSDSLCINSVYTFLYKSAALYSTLSLILRKVVSLF